MHMVKPIRLVPDAVAAAQFSQVPSVQRPTTGQQLNARYFVKQSNAVALPAPAPVFVGTDAGGNPVIAPFTPQITATVTSEPCTDCAENKRATYKPAQVPQFYPPATTSNNEVMATIYAAPQLPATPEVTALADLPINDSINILWHTVGYGRIGLNGVTGYGGNVVPPASLNGWNFISAHAPSAILLRNTKPIKLAGFVNHDAVLGNPVTFYASGNLIGEINTINKSTSDEWGDFILWPDEHLLEVVLNGNSNNGAHTIWAFQVIEE